MISSLQLNPLWTAVSLLALLALGLLVFVCVLRYGQKARSRQHQDIVKYLLVQPGQAASLQSLCGVLNCSPAKALKLVEELITAQLLGWKDDNLSLSDAGKMLAVQVLRAHRLYECWLAERTGYSAASWHEVAEKAEHRLSAQDCRRIEASLGYPLFDPHGDVIPSGELAESTHLEQLQGWLQQLQERQNSLQPNLLQAPLDTPLRIAHMEDEPKQRYEQLLELGLNVGHIIHIEQRGSEQLQLRCGKLPLRLTSSQAQALNVELLDEQQQNAPQVLPAELPGLDSLRNDETAHIVGIDASLVGMQRARLLDLGFVAGAAVSLHADSPHGNPRAYLIKGSIVALRNTQARCIKITLNPQTETTTDVE